MRDYLNISLLIIVTLMLSSVNAVKFQFSIAAQDKRCFAQLLTESTPFHFRIQSNFGQFVTQFNFKDGKTLISNDRDEGIKKIDSYASVTEEYIFCIKNNANQRKQFTFHLYWGLELSDLSSLPKAQDSKIINQMVDKINEVYQIVKDQESYSRIVNQYNMELQKLVSFKSVGFVFLSITVVIVISLMHYLEIKRVLKNRKII